MWHSVENLVDIVRDLQVQRALDSNQRFALRQGPAHAIIAKILEHVTVDGTMWVKIRGEQRVHIVTTSVEPGTRGLEYCKGYLFVDSPTYKRDASMLDEIQKRVRRLFFFLDTDGHADSRAGTIGNPPDEAHGPEALSHWASQAISTTNMHSKVADPALAFFLFKTTNTTKRLDVLHTIFVHTLEKLNTK